MWYFYCCLPPNFTVAWEITPRVIISTYYTTLHIRPYHSRKYHLVKILSHSCWSYAFVETRFSPIRVLIIRTVSVQHDDDNFVNIIKKFYSTIRHTSIVQRMFTFSNQEKYKKLLDKYKNISVRNESYKIYVIIINSNSILSNNKSY